MDYGKTREQIEVREQELHRSWSEVSSQLRQLEEKLIEITHELGALSQIRAGVRAAIGKASVIPHVPGLTEHIRSFLLGAKVAVTATQIRDSCEAVGIRARSRKDLLIAVHVTLKRLGLDIKKVKVDGKDAYLQRPGLRIPKVRSQ